MKIDILDLQRHLTIDKKKIKKLSGQILMALGENDAELSLVFSDDSYIRRLNRQYRNTDSNTDVLAFSMREGYGLSNESSMLGDVVISTETAKRQAKKRKQPLERELYLYLVHGILHLSGYDDETSANRNKMKAKEKELMGLLSIG